MGKPDWKQQRKRNGRRVAVPAAATLSGILLLFGMFSSLAAQSSRPTANPLALQLRYNAVDASAFPRIVSYVSVNDNAGFNIGELNENHFMVHEDGVRELPITVEELTDSGNVRVILVIDRSTSMQNQPIFDAKEAAKTFIRLMHATDEAAIVSFASKVTTDHDFSSDKNSLIAAIEQIEAQGGTAIYDALIHAAALIKARSGRRAIILLTDGHDKDSRSTLQQALDTVVPLGVPVFTIGLNLGSGSDEERVLQQIADATGGLYFRSPSSSDLEEIYRAISALLHHVYRITYTTHNPARDGTLRHVQITVNAQGSASSDTASYRAPMDRVTFALTTQDIPVPDRQFTLELAIPDTSHPLYEMRELQFVISYDRNYLSVKTPHESAVRFAPVFGSPQDRTLTLQVDESRGEIRVRVDKRVAAGLISGTGPLVSIDFLANAGLPDNYALTFRIRELVALNRDRRPIPSQTHDLTIRSYGYVPVHLAANGPLSPGRAFELQVLVPPGGKPVANLQNLSLVLKFDPSYLAVQDPHQANLAAGELFTKAGDYRFDYQVDATAGLVTLQLQMKNGQPLVSGHGVLATLTFRASLALPDSMPVHFEIANILGTDPTGWVVPLRTADLVVYSYGLIVWPGDTNHNGIVELSDVNQLGIFWAIRGPGRPDEPDPLAWSPQFSGRYPVRAAAHADADGDGRISERDLIPIGLNWKKQASSVAVARVTRFNNGSGLPVAGFLQASASPIQPDGRRAITLSLTGDSLTLQGLVFRMRYPAAGLQVVAVEPGTSWPQAPLAFVQNDASSGILAVGLMLPGDSEPATTAQDLVTVVLAGHGTKNLEGVAFYEAALVAPSGTTTDTQVHTSWEQVGMPGPTVFTVEPAYPNPFNPQTTVRFRLPEEATVVIAVHDARGRLVFEQRQAGLPSGEHRFRWAGRTGRGTTAPSGIYFLSIRAQGPAGEVWRAVQKITLIR